MTDQRRSYAPVSPNLSARRNQDDPPSLVPLQQPYYPGVQTPVTRTNPYLSPSNAQIHSPYQPPFQTTYQPPSLPFGHNSIPQHQEDEMDQDYPSRAQPTPAKRGRKPNVKSADQMTAMNAEPVKPYPGQLEGIQVTSKFPIARIKRIMQADEDVGKVAQVTPAAVNKALELFIVDFVLRSVEVAKSKGQKKVTMQHMKQVVTSEERFDWCTEFVSKVPDAPEKKSNAGKDDEDGPKRKRVATGSRKVKAKDSDDDY